MAEKLVLIDGYSILHRAYYGMPDLTNSEGLHTGAVRGFLNIFFKITEEEKPDYITVAFDVHAPTFRHKMYDGYKGTRKPMDDELRQQVPVLKDTLVAMGINICECEGYEADDVIGTLSLQAEGMGYDVSVISGDRDLLQLVSDRVRIVIPKTKKTGNEIENYGPDELRELYHVTAEEFIDLKAIMGDSSDNIPGIPGIGEKRAMPIIEQFHSIENAYEHADEIKPPSASKAFKEHYDLAVLSKKLAAIERHAPVQFDSEKSRVGDFYTADAYAMIKKLEFKQMYSRFEEVDITPGQKAGDPLKDKVHIIDSASEAGKLLDGLGAKDTAAVYVCREGEDIQGLSYCKDEENYYYFPVSMFFNEGMMADTAKKIFEKAGKVLCYDLKDVLKLCDDRDFTAMVNEMIASKRVADIRIAAYLADPLQSDYPCESIAAEYAGVNLPAKEELITKKTPKEELPQKYAILSQAAVCAVFKSAENLINTLKETDMSDLYYETELPLVAALYECEKNGMVCDREALSEYARSLAGGMTELETGIYKAAGEEFNILSPKQLGVILFEKMGIPGGKKTKTGYSTAADVLEKLEDEYPVVRDILQYRQYSKLKSTYAEGLQAFVRSDGRIHTNLNQTVTATGRLSSSDPNLQNIPVRIELGRQIRKVFSTPEGYVFVDADYSQIELRLLAHMSGDENLIEAYKSASDIHAITAAKVFGVPLEEVTKEQRRNAKAVNFGIIYGISSFGLGKDLSITTKQAGQYIEQYFEAYPGIKAFLDGLVASAKEKGYAKTMYNRRRPIPELKSNNFMQKSFGERVAMNAPIQGSAADIMKIAMNRVYSRLMKEAKDSKLVLQIHDELIIEASADEADLAERILREEMEGAANLRVPLIVDVQRGENWYETH